MILVAALCCIALSMQAQNNVVKLDDLEASGYEMQKALNEDGTALVERPYKWYSGIGKADDKQAALEIAQREAYSTVSRVITNVVEDKCERAALAVDGKVRKAIRSYWKQVADNVTKGCEPFGKAAVGYDTCTGQYVVTAKVAVRGDRFLKMLGEEPKVEAKLSSQEELSEFIEINNAIISAVRGE